MNIRKCRDKRTTSWVVVLLVAVAVTEAIQIAAALHHIDGDVVVFDTCRFGVDEGEFRAAIVVVVGQVLNTGAGAAITPIEG